ncbi:MAG: redoxin domain-containing protein [Lysobacterales bacterium]
MNWRGQILVLLVALVAGGAGLLAGRYWFGLHPPPDSLALGAEAIDFELPGLDGARLSTADFRGKVLVINFWAPWCAPCLREIPLLKAVRERHAGQVEILGVAMDEAETVRRYVSEQQIAYPIALAAVTDFALMRAYGNDRDALPFTVILDARGRLQARKLGEYHEDELTADVAAALGAR